MKYADFLHGQVRELLTEFGDIDILWFDFTFPPDKFNASITDMRDFVNGKSKEAWRAEELYNMIRQLAPNIILNDRLDLPADQYPWDVKTPEQSQPLRWVTDKGEPVVWETCQTLSGAWGYHRDEHTFKSVEQILKMLVDTVSKGGNLLLNVGPNARGQFDPRAIDRLLGIGEWMEYHDRSIHGCTQAPPEFVPPQDSRYTYNPQTNRLYLHLFSYPFAGSDMAVLQCQGLKNRIQYAQFLHDGSEILTVEKQNIQDPDEAPLKDGVMLVLPILKPDVEIPVVEIFLK